MALDPSILSDLDALRAAGFDFQTGTTASERAASARAPGFGAGTTQAGAVTGRPLAGRTFAQPGPGLARARAAAAAAPVARGVVGRALGAAFGLPGIVAATAAPGVVEGVRRSSEIPAVPETRLARAGAIASGVRDFMTDLPESIVGAITGAGPQSSIVRDPAEFNVPTPATAPQAAPGGAPAPAQAAPIPSDATPGGQTYRILNQDGSTSYTNLRDAARAATNAGAQVTPLTDANIRGGGVGFGVTPEDHQRAVERADRDRQHALSISLRDKQFAQARRFARTDDDFALIDVREQMIGAKGKKLQALREQEKQLAAGRATVGAATVKAAADALKAGPAAAKQTAEANRLNMLLGLITGGIRGGGLTGVDAVRLLAGIAPQSDKIHVTDPLVPGQDPTVIRIRAGSSVAENLPTIKRHAPGTIVEDEKGKKHVLQADGSLKAQR